MKRLKLWLYKKRGRTLVYGKETPSCDEVEFLVEELDSKSQSVMDMECREDGRRSPRLIREWLLRHQVKGWTFREKLTFENGMLDDSSFEKVMSLPGPVLSRIIGQFNKDMLSDDEKNDIARQSVLLFGSAGTVENPHPLVSLYVTLSDMWQKFGLNYFDLQRLPASVKDGLKEIMHLEGQARASAAKSESSVDDGLMKRMGMK